MRDSTIVTITNVNGSKSYTLGQLAKKIIRYIIISIVAIIVISFGIIYFLSDKVDDYEAILQKKIKEYQTIEKKYNDLKVANLKLEDQITKKEEKLINIQNKVSDIETLIGLKPKEGLEINGRLDFAHTSAKERILMLRLIPSGQPIAFKGITSKFGWRNNPLKPRKREFHPGIDLRAKVGTPVFATADGIVEFARKKSKIGYGKLIILNHSLGFKTIYAHLHRVKVKTGQFVKKGDIIGLSGNTGYSNGPHLHYEVRYIGIPLDPKPFMWWNLKNYNKIFKKTKKKVKWESLIEGTKWQWTLLKQLSSQKEQKLSEKLISNQNSISTGKSKAK